MFHFSGDTMVLPVVSAYRTMNRHPKCFLCSLRPNYNWSDRNFLCNFNTWDRIETTWYHDDLFPTIGFSPQIQKSAGLTNDLAIKWSLSIIYHAWNAVFHHQMDTEKRVKNTRRSGVYLAKFEVFYLVMKHCVECSILLHDFRKRN